MYIERNIPHTVAAGVRDLTDVRPNDCGATTAVLVCIHDGIAEAGI